MRDIHGSHGEVKLSAILSLLLLGFAFYEATQFGPVLFAQYQFKDAVIEEAKFSRGKSEDVIRTSLSRKASELGLPISRDMIKVTREPTRTRIQVQYHLKVEWMPNKEYAWDVNEVAESVLF